MESEVRSDPWWELEQWLECGFVFPEPEQHSCERELEHRFPSRSY